MTALVKKTIPKLVWLYGAAALIAIILAFQNNSIISQILLLGIVGASTMAVFGCAIYRYRPDPAWFLIVPVPPLLTLSALIPKLLSSSSKELALILSNLIALPGYLLLILAFWTIWRKRLAKQPRDTTKEHLADLLVIFLVGFMLAWFIVVEPSAAHTHFRILSELPGALRLTLDPLILYLAGRLAFSKGPPHPHLPLVSSLLMLIAAGLTANDLGTALVGLNWLPYLSSQALLDPVLAITAIGLLALHPQMSSLTSPQEPLEHRLHNSRLPLLTASMLIPTILAVDFTIHGFADRLLVLLGAMGIGLAVLLARTEVINKSEDQEARLQYEATHDSLTDLPNRAGLVAKLTKLLKAKEETKQQELALLFCDLDRFKYVNDTWGHPVGDELLRHVSARLTHVVRDSDIVGRLGGDEFIVICSDVNSEQDLSRATERIMEIFNSPFSLTVGEIHVGISIGVSRAHPGASAEDLLREADVAMYNAKKSGRGQVVNFGETMRVQANEHYEIDSALCGALERDEFEVTYQPVVKLETGKPVGFEALLRWNHPKLGEVGPNRFIPIAEESGRIVEIGMHVLSTACLQLASLNSTRDAQSHLAMAVNISPRQLLERSFISDVKAVLAWTGIDANDLTLEITETAILTKPTAILKTLRELQRLGVHLSLDDFGTGYSSLSHIYKFPVNQIKIDRSFVKNLGKDQTSRDIVTAVTTMANSRGLELVAEGVETTEQQEILTIIGCPLAQGWLFSKAMTSTQVHDYLTVNTIPSTSPQI